MNFFRRLFWVFNKFFMVPMFRLGFGPFMGNPITGYIMVLKTIGRKTGKIRFTPVIYTIMGGNVYCIAGFGKISHWYLNLKADPNLEVILPSGAIAGVAEDVSDPDESLIAFRRMLKSGGFSGFFEGYNPFRASDERMRKSLGRLPVIRIRSTGLGSGASDPQGWMWVTMVVVTVLILRLLLM